jgi:hypothetical protein
MPNAMLKRPAACIVCMVSLSSKGSGWMVDSKHAINSVIEDGRHCTRELLVCLPLFNYILFRNKAFT